MNDRSKTRIFELPQDVIRKIAAGEVITGPQAVVKELVENALDADATEISVEIENGGKSYIKVSDNGTGMNEEEVKIAIKHHTTSKLRNVNDLERINTYGFRGEALASIVQVSRTRIITKDEYSTMATILEVEGGKITDIGKMGRKRGTTVEVRDIFFNLPARRRFLKSSNIEGRMVTDILQRFALVQNNVRWNYVRDGKTVFNLPMSGGMYERVQMLFPELRSEELLEVAYEKEGVRINGVISSPRLTFPSRNHQFVFVNGRYVRSGLILALMEKGYSEMLEKGRHPFISVNIELDPGEVDVNVHPQKLEVRFHREELVLNLVKSAIRESLQHRMHMVIETTPHTEKTEEKASSKKETLVKEQFSTYRVPAAYGGLFPVEKTGPVEALKGIDEESKSELFSSLKPHLVLNNRYILCEYDEGIAIVDFHALHERILYEELLSKMEELLAPQYLIIPEKLDVDISTRELIEEIDSYLEEIGFKLRASADSVELLAVPRVLNSVDYTSALLEILDEFKLMGILTREEIYRKTFATIACHAAMKTGDRLTLEDAEYLISRMKTQKLKACPHGRPLMYKLEFKQLDRFFRR